MFRGDVLKKLREERNMTQQELANAFNISDATINRYEKGLRQPDPDMINRFADFFNVSTDYLFGRTMTRNVVDKITDAVNSEPELIEFWNQLKERPDLQLLFKQAKQLEDKDIKQLMRIIKAIEDEEDTND